MDIKIYINDEKVSIDKPVEKKILLEYPFELEYPLRNPHHFELENKERLMDCSLQYVPVSFSVREINILNKEKILTYRDLISYTPRQLLKLKNLSRKNLTEIEERLKMVGLKLKGETDE